jgi:dihydrofolate reductase
MSIPHIHIIAAIGKNRALGKNEKLLWHIPDDLKRFKKLTWGHPIIMGRKTFESVVSVLGKPLPGRMNIVVTRDPSWQYDGVIVMHSLEEGIEKAKELDQQEIFIGGGADIYRQALPLVDKLYLTLIDDEKEGDAFFPPYEDQFTVQTFEESRRWGNIHYQWIDLVRS